MHCHLHPLHGRSQQCCMLVLDCKQGIKHVCKILETSCYAAGMVQAGCVS